MEWWIGIILEVDKEKGDARTNFMHPHGPSRSFHWPRVDDICWVPITHLLCAIDAPTTITGRQAGRQYRITQLDVKKVEELMLTFNS